MNRRPGVATGETGVRYAVTDDELLNALLQLVVGHEISCGLNHLLVAAGLALEASCARGLPQLDALLLASFFRIAAEKAERLARACPIDSDPDSSPRASA